MLAPSVHVVSLVISWVEIFVFLRGVENGIKAVAFVRIFGRLVHEYYKIREKIS